MQVSKIVLSLATGAAFAAVSASFAAVPANAAATADTTAQVAVQTQVPNWTQTQQNANTKITRAQVRQELVDAEHNGQLDALRSLYRGS